jgi:cytoskeletal protein RodZ
MSDISQIDGQTVRRKREALGLAVSDVATTACLSTKQIKQIEEGGMTAFYSENVKLTAARKVAALLGMTEAQLFGQVTPEVMQQDPPSPVDEDDVDGQSTFRGALSSHASAPAETAAISRSESWHVLAQPPENPDPSEQASPTNEQIGGSDDLAQSEAPDSAVPAASATEADQPPPPESSNANYLIKILALFLVALAAAALLRQQAGDEKAQATANEPAPAVSPVPEPAMPTAQEPTGNAAQATAIGTDPATVLPAAGADKAPSVSLPADPVSKPLPETPSATTSK